MLAEEFYSISQSLERHHALFQVLWSLSRPMFSTDVPTAAVSFDKLGESVNWVINEQFWNGLTQIQKEFVLSHEMLHVFFNHGLRLKDLPSSELQLANQAADIVVNHTLVNSFGFTRLDVDPANQYCWVDTVFPGQTIPDNKSFEYYFDLLKQNASSDTEQSIQPGQGQTVDSHDGLGSFDDTACDAIRENCQSVSQEAIDEMNQIIKDATQNESTSHEAGKTAGSGFYIVKKVPVPVKPKWETVIKKWAQRHEVEQEQDQWTRTDRRFLGLGNNFFLPTEAEIEHFKQDRIKVWFFQDTSGSCYGFIDRFFKAARSLNPEKFDVRMFCFDTQVYETSLESGKLYGFGGTSFSCIERKIQEITKDEQIGYPKAVFVITDGYGDTVQPAKPENWYWFIDGSFSLVPAKSNKYNLKNFE